MTNPNLSQEAIDTLKAMRKQGSCSIHKFTIKNELESQGFAVLKQETKDHDFYEITEEGKKYLEEN